jgi:putative flippase GtrA
MSAAMKKFRDRCVRGGGIYMYLRSVLSSGVASCIDVALSFVGFALLDMHPWLATSVGAMAGGIVNCTINYRYTFRARGCSKQAVALKYALVWLGSLMLNAAGTTWLYQELVYLLRAADVAVVEDLCYAVARMTVAMLVSVVWNYLLQRYFVYRSVPFPAPRRPKYKKEKEITQTI